MYEKLVITLCIAWKHLLFIFLGKGAHVLSAFCNVAFLFEGDQVIIENIGVVFLLINDFILTVLQNN